MQSLKLILKGFLVGIGKVIPGVSGAMLAISFGIYEKSLDAITHFFSDVTTHFWFLLKIGIGVLLAIVLGSKIIAFLLTRYYLCTMLLFIGMIIGGLPSLYKTISSSVSILEIFIFLISFLFVILLSFIHTGTFISGDHEIGGGLYFAMGMIDAATMVIPGISGTAIFMLLGLYETSLSLFASLDTISHIIENIPIILPFGMGLVLGLFGVSFIMSNILKKYPTETYYSIFGFQVAAIIIIFLRTVEYSYHWLEIIVAFVCFLIGFYVSVLFDEL